MQAEGLLLKVRRMRATNQPFSAPKERRNPLRTLETHLVPPPRRCRTTDCEASLKHARNTSQTRSPPRTTRSPRKRATPWTRIRGDVGDADGARREFVDTLRATEERLLRLKRTLAEDFETERALVDRIEARVAHLRELPCGDTPPNADPETTARRRRAWESTRLDRMVVDYAVRRGDRELAERVARETGVEHLVDIDAHESGLDASVAMRRDGAYLPAITWLDSIEETLLGNAFRNAPEATFADARWFRFFHCLELARSERYLEAATYAREEALPRQISGYPSLSTFTKRGVAVWPELMLALATHHHRKAPFDDGAALSAALRPETRRENAASLDVIRMRVPPAYRGVAPRGDAARGSRGFEKGDAACLSRQRVAHVRGAGRPFDARLAPRTRAPAPRSRRRRRGSCAASRARRWTRTTRRMALPNGQVYSANAVASMRRGGVVYCPRTREGPFVWDEIRKVFWREGRAAIPATTK